MHAPPRYPAVAPLLFRISKVIGTGLPAVSNGFVRFSTFSLAPVFCLSGRPEQKIQIPG